MCSTRCAAGSIRTACPVITICRARPSISSMRSPRSRSRPISRLTWGAATRTMFQFRALVAQLARQRGEDPQGKIAKLRMALEQMRWLPHQLGTRYVFLTQPAFEVSHFNGAGAPLTMRAVIGKPNAQTYFFTDRIKEITYNPYWNVPRSIVINEMLRKLWRDPSYLDRLGYEVSNSRGREVASSVVDWAAVATQRIGVDVRQPPGRGNALGRLKIDFPNKH